MELMRLQEARRGPNARWDPWGFVIYKSPEIQDLAQWRACRERFDTILRDYTDFYAEYPGLDECLSRMKFRWVEDAGDAGGSIKSIAEYVRPVLGGRWTKPAIQQRLLLSCLFKDST